jgi:hypothetical protein
MYFVVGSAVEVDLHVGSSDWFVVGSAVEVDLHVGSCDLLHYYY